MGLGLVTVEV